jgi:hypothetical protein
MKKILGLIIFLAGAIPSGPAAGKSADQPVPAQDPEGPAKRMISYSFTLRNEKNTLVKEATFLTYAPVKKTATQQCLNVKASHPYELSTDEFGNQILRFHLENLAPFSTRIISIEAELETGPPAKTELKNRESYLRSEKYLEADHPEIKKLAATLPTVKQKYIWVSQQLKPSGYQPDDLGAVYALKNKSGDCTEYACLFAALCRASGIPARVIGGYVCGRSQVLQPDKYHNWTECYVDGSWIPVDPQKRVFNKNYHDFIGMKIFYVNSQSEMKDDHRFRLEGGELKVKMNY